MKRLLLLLVLVLCTSLLYSQKRSQENSIFIESNLIMMTSISYDRYIGVSDNASLILGSEYVMGTGFGWGTHWVVPELGILLFGPKHFIETSAQYAVDISPNSSDLEMYGREHSIGARVAYRLQTESRVNFRANINTYFSIDPIIVPTIGVGYNF